MTKIALLQSNYIPWKGVFDLIASVDLFVFYDTCDFTRQDWRSRNRIKTAHGPQWLSVPVEHAPLGTPISAIRIRRDMPWRRKHRQALELTYGRAPHFAEYRGLLDEIYQPDRENLSDFNRAVTRRIARELGIATPFADAADYALEGHKDDRILDLCRKTGADAYLSGPAARDYIVPEKFRRAGVALEYIRYDYPEYPQLHPPFDHFVTVLDVLFHCGARAPELICRRQSERAV